MAFEAILCARNQHRTFAKRGVGLNPVNPGKTAVYNSVLPILEIALNCNHL